MQSIATARPVLRPLPRPVRREERRQTNYSPRRNDVKLMGLGSARRKTWTRHREFAREPSSAKANWRSASRPNPPATEVGGSLVCSPAGAEAGNQENNNNRVDERDLHRNATDPCPARSAALALARRRSRGLDSRRRAHNCFEHPTAHTTKAVRRRRTELASPRICRVESPLVLRSELRVGDRFRICAKSRGAAGPRGRLQRTRSKNRGHVRRRVGQ